MTVHSNRRRTLVYIAVAVIVAIAAVFAVLGQRSKAQPAAADEGMSQSAAPSAEAVDPSPSRSPEEQAKADLEQLVRAYYAAENEIYLDKSKVAVSGLADFLTGVALAERAGDINGFRANGHVLHDSGVEVHSVQIQSLNLASVPPNAKLAVCRTITATGTDGISGEPASLTSRRLNVWSATGEQGSWKLNEYTAGEVDSC